MRRTKGRIMPTYRVANHDKYQTGAAKKNLHGMPWVKVWKKILAGYDFTELSPGDRYALIGLFLICDDITGALPEREVEVAKKLSLDEFSFEPFMLFLEECPDIDSPEYMKWRDELLQDRRDERTPNPASNGKPAPRKKKPQYLDEFALFYEAYPNHKAKADALKAWKAIDKINVPLITDIMIGLEAQQHTHEWTKDSGKYIPLPASWLRGKRWQDEVIPGGGNVITKNILTGPCPKCGLVAKVESELQHMEHTCECSHIFSIAN